MALAQNPSIAALSNLVLYYDASNVKSFPGAGTSIYDMSGNNNTGTLTNGPLWSAANNGVISFDGSDDYISISSATNLLTFGTNDFSVSFWINLSSTSNQTILTSYNAYNSGFATYFFIGYFNSLAGIYILDSSGNTTNPTAVGASISQNTWTNFVFTRTGTTYYCYRNGIIINSQSDPDVNFSGSGRPILIGGGLADFGYMNGKTSSFQVYNAALTAAQIKQNYDATKGRFINTPFAPTDISGLSLWFDADDPRTLFSNTSGTTRATTDATALALWSDKSGNGRNAYQATGASQPLLKTSILNNRNVVRFDGSNDSLATAAAQVANTTDGSFTAFAVAQRTTTSGAICVLNQDNSSATRCSQFVNFGANGNVESIAFTGGVAKFGYTASGTISANNYYLIESTANASTISAYSNGIAGSGAITGGNLAVPSQAVTLGAYSTGIQYLNGDIAEILLYNSVLSSTNRIKVEQYLQNKWGVVTPFLPTQISGLQLWLDSSDSGSLFQDSAAVIPATKDGDPVGCWKDKSGNSRNVTQSTIANRPALKTSVQNSKNGIRFDGTNDFLTGSYGTTYSNWTLFVVCKFSSASSYPMVYTDGNNELRLYGGTGYLEIISTNDPLVRDTVSCVGSTIIVTPWNGAAFALYKNGISLGTGVTQRALASTFYISSRSGSSYYLVGDVYEVITYNAALTTAQRQQVEAYLNQKWGVF